MSARGKSRINGIISVSIPYASHNVIESNSSRRASVNSFLRTEAAPSILAGSAVQLTWY